MQYLKFYSSSAHYHRQKYLPEKKIASQESLAVAFDFDKYFDIDELNKSIIKIRPP